jgi:hypothetical protein
MFIGIYGLRWPSTKAGQLAEKSSTWQYSVARHRFLLVLLLTGGLLVRIQPEEPVFLEICEVGLLARTTVTQNVTQQRDCVHEVTIRIRRFWREFTRALDWTPAISGAEP